MLYEIKNELSQTNGTRADSRRKIIGQVLLNRK